MYLVDVVICYRFEGPLVKFSKYGPSAQMTMPARRASKLCAKRRAASPHIFFLSLICYVIPGNIEHLPEWPEEIIQYHVKQCPRPIGIIKYNVKQTSAAH